MNNSILIGSSLLLACLLATPVFASPAADDVHVADPYARAVPDVVKNSAVFLTLHNAGSADRALVSASSGIADVVELHTHIKDGDVMRMRRVERIPLPAGDTTVLEPGGLHIMLLGLKGPLNTGAEVQVDLTFADGSAKTIVAPVKAVSAMQQGGGHEHHHHHH